MNPNNFIDWAAHRSFLAHRSFF